MREAAGHRPAPAASESSFFLVENTPAHGPAGEYLSRGGVKALGQLWHQRLDAPTAPTTDLGARSRKTMGAPRSASDAASTTVTGRGRLRPDKEPIDTGRAGHE